MRGQAIVLAAALMACGGCFPTFQSPRVEPGWQTTAAVTVIGNRSQGINTPNYMVTLAPSYGFGRRFELGVPVGVTASPPDERGNDGQRWLMVAPYAKLALNRADSKEHVAVILQTAAIVPTSLGIRYGHDAGKWEPEFGFSYIVTESGDDHFSSDRRMFQSYSLWMASFGAEYFTSAARPAWEVGLLLGNHDRSTSRPPYSFGRVSDVDLFVGFRVGRR